MKGEASGTAVGVRAAAAPFVTSSIKTCICIFSIAVLVTLMVGCEKFALDRQMEELCKIDGGVRVYETVTLPPEMFDQSGEPFPGWRQRQQSDRFGPGYEYVVETIHIKEGDPVRGEGRLRRTWERIYRRSDGKILSEAISYGRSGGDFIAFAHPTSKHCPDYRSSNEMLVARTFLKEAN